MTRLEIATSLLQAMLSNAGSKLDKVKAALEYADLLIAESKKKLKGVA